MGYVSDKYGRKPALIWGTVIYALFGTIKSFSWVYESYLVFEFLENFFGAATYPTACILGMKLKTKSYT